LLDLSLHKSLVIGGPNIYADKIVDLESIDALDAYVRVVFSNTYLEGHNLSSRIKMDRFKKSLHDYTLDFNSSYSYRKNYISLKVRAYMYIGGLRTDALRANLTTDWQATKYASLIALKSNVAKYSYGVQP
jgi:hypothetical protein